MAKWNFEIWWQNCQGSLSQVLGRRFLSLPLKNYHSDNNKIFWEHLFLSVWPDFTIKSNPIFLKKVALKVGSAVWNNTGCFFKMAQKLPNIWATFVRNFVTNNFKNFPIWSHWFVCFKGKSGSFIFLRRIMVTKIKHFILVNYDSRVVRWQFYSSKLWL